MKSQENIFDGLELPVYLLEMTDSGIENQSTAVDLPADTGNGNAKGNSKNKRKTSKKKRETVTFQQQDEDDKRKVAAKYHQKAEEIEKANEKIIAMLKADHAKERDKLKEQMNEIQRQNDLIMALLAQFLPGIDVDGKLKKVQGEQSALVAVLDGSGSGSSKQIDGDMAELEKESHGLLEELEAEKEAADELTQRKKGKRVKNGRGSADDGKSNLKVQMQEQNRLLSDQLQQLKGQKNRKALQGQKMGEIIAKNQRSSDHIEQTADGNANAIIDVSLVQMPIDDEPEEDLQQKQIEEKRAKRRQTKRERKSAKQLQNGAMDFQALIGPEKSTPIDDTAISHARKPNKTTGKEDETADRIKSEAAKNLAEEEAERLRLTEVESQRARVRPQETPDGDEKSTARLRKPTKTSGSDDEASERIERENATKLAARAAERLQDEIGKEGQQTGATPQKTIELVDKTTAVYRRPNKASGQADEEAEELKRKKERAKKLSEDEEAERNRLAEVEIENQRARAQPEEEVDER